MSSSLFSPMWLFLKVVKRTGRYVMEISTYENYVSSCARQNESFTKLLQKEGILVKDSTDKKFKILYNGR